jgi:alpha-amylase/alpha-mannosidase (GH57 family)
VLRLLEIQRHLLLMYTSCGWFFDELSRIETVQVLAYAARAVQLADLVLDVDLEDAFVERLALAPSNLPQWGHGGRIYEELVRPCAPTSRRSPPTSPSAACRASTAQRADRLLRGRPR